MRGVARAGPRRARGTTRTRQHQVFDACETQSGTRRQGEPGLGRDREDQRPSRPTTGAQTARDGSAQDGNGNISQPTTSAESDEGGEGHQPEPQARSRWSSRMEQSRTPAETSAEKMSRATRWLAHHVLAPQRRVVRVEHDQDVEQPGHLGEGVAVLVGHRRHAARLEAERARHEVRQADRHLGQAEQRTRADRRGRSSSARRASMATPRANSAPIAHQEERGPCRCAAGRDVRRRAAARPGCTRARRCLASRRGTILGIRHASSSRASPRRTRDAYHRRSRVGCSAREDDRLRYFAPVACRGRRSPLTARARPPVGRRRGRSAAPARSCPSTDVRPGMKGVGPHRLRRHAASTSSRSRSSASWRTSGPSRA